MTLEEFKQYVLVDAQDKYTEQQTLVLFEISKRFSDLAFKRWGGRMVSTETTSATIVV